MPNTFRTWIRRCFTLGGGRKPYRHTPRLALELLEDRAMPSVTAMPDLYGATAGTMLQASTVLANDSTSGSGTLTASQLTSPSHGSLTFLSDGTFSYLPNSSFSGSDSFQYTATDGTDSALQLVTINVASGGGNTPPGGGGSNHAPYIMSGHTYYTLHDRAITDVDLAIRVYDPDNDPQQITVTTQPAHGTLTLNTDGKYTYTPAAGWTGTDSLVFHSNDGHVDSNDATMFFTVSNNAPTLTSSSFSLRHDSQWSLDLTSVASDSDGDVLTPVVVTQPLHGAVLVDSSGVLRFIPDTHYAGSDSFTFKVNDGAADSNVATISLSITSTAPTVSNDGAYQVSKNGVLTISASQLTANDTVADGDSASITIDTQPAHGQLIDMNDGTFEYHPDADFTGSDSFNYTLSNGVSVSSYATVSLNVVNASLVANTDAFITATDTGYTFSAADLLRNDSTSLTGNMEVTAIATPAHGTLTQDAVTGLWTYTPAAAYTGTDTFQYTVSIGNVIALGAVQMMVGQVPGLRIGQPIPENRLNLATVLLDNFDTWANQVDPFNNNERYLSLARINELVALRTVTRWDAAALAALKLLVLQSPSDIWQTGGYASLFGVTQNRRYVTRADIEAFGNFIILSTNPQQHARAVLLNNAYQGMVNRVMVNRTLPGQVFQLLPNGAGALRMADSVAQGVVGDCAFMSTVIGNLRSKGTTAISQSIVRVNDTANGVPRFDVTVYDNNPQHTPIIVRNVEAPTDAELAMYAVTNDGSFWLPIYEKAYVSQWPRTPQMVFWGIGGYDSVASGENTSTAIQRVTGHNATSYGGLPNNLNLANLPDLLFSIYPTVAGNQLLPGKVVTVGSMDRNLMPAGAIAAGMPVAHAFTVIAFDNINSRVTLQNPWHTSGRYGYQFEITLAQLVSWFDQLSIEA